MSLEETNKKLEELEGLIKKATGDVAKEDVEPVEGWYFPDEFLDCVGHEKSTKGISDEEARRICTEYMQRANMPDDPSNILDSVPKSRPYVGRMNQDSGDYEQIVVDARSRKDAKVSPGTVEYNRRTQLWKEQKDYDPTALRPEEEYGDLLGDPAFQKCVGELIDKGWPLSSARNACQYRMSGGV